MTASETPRSPQLPTRKELRLARQAAAEEARLRAEEEERVRAEEERVRAADERREREARLAEMLERSASQEPRTSRRSRRAAEPEIATVELSVAKNDAASEPVRDVTPELPAVAEAEAVTEIIETPADVAELEADAAELEADVAELDAEIAELDTEVAELNWPEIPARAATSHVKPKKSRPTMFSRVAVGVAAVVAGLGATAGIVGVRSASTAHAAVSTNDSVLNTLVESATPQTPDSLKAKSGAADEWRLSEAGRSLAEATPGELCNAMNGASSLASAFYDESDSVILPLALGDYRLTSNYGLRYDPFTGQSSTHLGQDLAAPLNTPIYAVADGTVIHAGLGIDGRSNNLVIVQHEVNGVKFTTWYVHMYDDGVLVKEGDKVKVGDTIALVGNNGRSTGSHLHFEVHLGEGVGASTTTDPIEFLNSLGARDVADLCF